MNWLLNLRFLSIPHPNPLPRERVFEERERVRENDFAKNDNPIINPTMNACVFLDRDGVINKDNPNYTFRKEEFEILPGVIEALRELKSNGHKLIVVTNQSGIAQGLYTQQQMEDCHQFFQLQ